MNKPQIVTLVGGSGFIGRYVVGTLAAAGYRVQVLSRDPVAAQHLKTAGDVGQIALQYADITKPDTLRGKLDGSYAVVNLAGILFESGAQDFSSVHAQGGERLAKAGRTAGVERFVHISAIGAEQALKSKYARTKATAERAILAAFPKASILRPSVVFGPEDQFFNLFARLARFSPVLPLIGGGNTLFQPVYVGDVAAAIKATIEKNDACGQVYELGGPQTLSLREVFAYILRHTHRQRCLLPVPYALAHLIGWANEWLPAPLITRDQVTLLHYDNVTNTALPGLAALGVNATSIDLVAPGYLRRHAPTPAQAQP